MGTQSGTAPFPLPLNTNGAGKEKRQEKFDENLNEILTGKMGAH